MAKFCGQCGAELRDSAAFCDSCGAKCAVVTPEAPKEEAPVSFSDTPAAQYSPDKSSAKSAKKSKAGLLIALIAIVLVIGIVLSAVFFVLPMFKKGDDNYSVAGKDFITFKSPDTRYYISGVDYLDTNQNNDAMSLKRIGLEPDMRSLWAFASTGESAFYAAADRDSIDITTYEDPTKYDEYAEYEDYLKENDITLKSVPVNTEWLTLEELTNQVDETTAGAIIAASSYWQYYDGYIYFTIYPDKELFASGDYNEVAFTLMRINVENKTVQKIGSDLAANSFVVHDGWIYFSDIGYKPEKTEDGYTIQNYTGENIGIYKMKTDGSEKTKLLGFEFEADGEKVEYNEEYEMYRHDVYSNLSAYNGKLYYIDNRDPRNSVLTRMDFDGSDVEKVAQTPTYEYTIDTNTNTLYYVTGSYYVNNMTDVKDIYKVNLKELTEEKFASYALKMDRIQISCADNVLYISSPNQEFGTNGQTIGTEEEPALIGIYYDLEEKKATAAYQYAIWGEDTIKQSPAGEIVQPGSIERYVTYWADYDASDERFIFYN